jgi:beta-N-acetylhexosaminidase
VAAQLVARMSPEDKLGQMLIVQFSGPTYTPDEQKMVTSVHPGGVLLFRDAMGTAQQLQDLLKSVQQDSLVPLFTFVTEEGGIVDPLAKYFGPRRAAADIGAAGATLATSAGSQTGKDLLSFGFNVDLAPTLNIANGSGADSRSFGATPDLVTTQAGAWLTGLQGASVIGRAKTFPGSGGADDLAPYRALIASAQLQMIMSTTEVSPTLDPSLPAALSTAVITGVLRNELHFTGVAITDSLYVQAVTARFTLAQAAVMAIVAGNDMVMGLFAPNQVSATIATLKAEIAAGKLSQQQVDASVTRILALKLRFHLIASSTGVTGASTSRAAAARVLPRG